MDLFCIDKLEGLLSQIVKLLDNRVVNASNHFFKELLCLVSEVVGFSCPDCALVGYLVANTVSQLLDL